MLDRNINSIIYQSYIELGNVALELSKAAGAGLEGTSYTKTLWNKAIMLDSILDEIVDHIEVKDNAVYRILGITDLEMNKLLSCLKEVANINDFPSAPFIPSRFASNIAVGTGAQGPAGNNGVSSYTAVAFAADDLGTDFSLTPSATRPYIAFKTSTTPIPPIASSFTGLWIKYVGEGDTPFANIDLDTGTEDIDVFTTSLAKEIRWDYHIVKSTNAVGGIIRATRNGNNINWTNTYQSPIGTIDVTLDVDINAGNVRLRGTATSNDWIITGVRKIVAA